MSAAPVDAEGNDREGARIATTQRRRECHRARCTGRACRRCRTWPWPSRAACSPDRRVTLADRRRCRRWAGDPGSAAAWPTDPEESTIVGSIASGIRSFSSSASSQSIGRVDQSGDGGIGGVCDVEGVAARCRAAREGPGHPAVDRPEAEFALFGPRPVGVDLVEDGHDLGRRRVRGQTDSLGLQDEAGPDGAQVLPTDAGRDGLAGGALPHDARGTLVGDPDARHRTARRRARRGRPPERRRPSAPRRTPPGREPASRAAGGRGARARHVASGRTMAARTPDVPTSTTRMLPPPALMSRAPVRMARRDRTCPG